VITVSDLIISIVAMFCSIGVVTFIILVYFCIYCIVEHIRKKRKQSKQQVSYYTRYRPYPSVECCCEDCIYFTNVVHHADGRKVGLCELHNRHMYAYSFCFSAKKER
jgi:predicted membrane protein